DRVDEVAERRVDRAARVDAVDVDQPVERDEDGRDRDGRERAALAQRGKDRRERAGQRQGQHAEAQRPRRPVRDDLERPGGLEHPDEDREGAPQQVGGEPEGEARAVDVGRDRGGRGGAGHGRTLSRRRTRGESASAQARPDSSAPTRMSSWARSVLGRTPSRSQRARSSRAMALPSFAWGESSLSASVSSLNEPSVAMSSRTREKTKGPSSRTDAARTRRSSQ